eukprot:5683465-Amphidinium_carterae.2
MLAGTAGVAAPRLSMFFAEPYSEVHQSAHTAFRSSLAHSLAPGQCCSAADSSVFNRNSRLRASTRGISC